MCPQHFLQLLGRDLIPLDGLALGNHQGRKMVMPVDFSEWFAAIHDFCL
jgi:hypothetical protein